MRNITRHGLNFTMNAPVRLILTNECTKNWDRASKTAIVISGGAAPCGPPKAMGCR